MMYALGNVEEEQRADPEFRIPPTFLRESLEPGDLAEIMLLSEELAEPAWVQVQDVLGPGIYSGIFESGLPVEFGAEHVADVVAREDRSPSMGAPPRQEPFEVLRRPKPPRPSDPFEVLRRPPPPRPPSPFEVLRRPPGAPPPAPPRAPGPTPVEPKRGFFERFNIFRRKPKITIEPIPAAERRAPSAPPRQAPALPAPPQAAAPPGVRVPPPPPASSPPPPTGLVPATERPAPAAATPSSLIIPETHEPPALAPDAFTMLVPPGEGPPRGGLVIPASAAMPVSASPDIFEILAPPGPGGLVPAAPTSAFDILVSPSSAPMALGPLEARPGGMSVFDIIAPEPGALAPYDPALLDPFTMILPTASEDLFEGPLAPQAEIPGEQQWTGWGAPPTFQPAAAPPPEKKRNSRQPKEIPKLKWVKRGKTWQMPSPREVIPWIEWAFTMENLWGLIRTDRVTEEFRQMVIEQEDTGEPALIPFQTVAHYNSDWAREVADFFDIPSEVTQSWFDEIDRMNEQEEDTYEVDEELGAFFSEYYHIVQEAFSLIQPKDIPGEIIIDSYEDQIVLAYWEGLSKEEQARLERERQFIHEQEQRAVEDRKKALRKIWGKMPPVEELVGFIEEKFDVDDLWKHIRKERKTHAFKDELEENGNAHIELEKVASEGPDFYNELGYYFSLPPEVLALYLDRKEPLEGALWEEVLGEFLDRIAQAFEETKPRDIPGMITVAEDEGGSRDRYLMYVEEFE